MSRRVGCVENAKSGSTQKRSGLLEIKNEDLLSRQNLCVLFAFVTKYIKTFKCTVNLDHTIKSVRISAGVGMKYSYTLSGSRVVVCSTLVHTNQNGAFSHSATLSDY